LSGAAAQGTFARHMQEQFEIIPARIRHVRHLIVSPVIVLSFMDEKWRSPARLQAVP
jgi:hypothetical protein